MVIRRGRRPLMRLRVPAHAPALQMEDLSSVPSAIRRTEHPTAHRAAVLLAEQSQAVARLCATESTGLKSGLFAAEAFDR